MNDVHAKITEVDGKLVAVILTPDSPAVENVTLFAHLPSAHGFMKIAFYDMEHLKAIEYFGQRAIDVYEAIANASIKLTTEGEQWYALRVELRRKDYRRREKFANELGQALDESGKGWLNPVVLPDGEGFLFDLALKDGGQEVIKAILKRWGAKWELRLKEHGI
jgi:hypothetical protein